MADRFTSMSKTELQSEARLRGLSDAGSKASLLQRLRESEGGGPAGEHDVEPAHDDREVADQEEVSADTGREHERAQQADDNRNGEQPKLGTLIASAKESLQALIGRPVDGVSGVEPTDGGYRVTVEVVELARVPASTDVLATFEVQMDSDGELLSFSRTQRYYRNQRSEE